MHWVRTGQEKAERTDAWTGRVFLALLSSEET